MGAVAMLQMVPPANTTQPAQEVSTIVIVRVEYATVTHTVSYTILQTTTEQITFTQPLTQLTLSTTTETSTYTLGLSFPQEDWAWIALVTALVAFGVGCVLRPLFHAGSKRR
jgi:hypothetical protein